MQTKLRLEMEGEKTRQQHLRELEDKDNEVEEMRAATQKKVRHLETQIEEEYEEKQKMSKDKRELERKLKTLSEIEPISNRGVYNVYCSIFTSDAGVIVYEF